MEIEKLKKEYCKGIYQTQALLVRDAPFKLRSGSLSHIYLNHRAFLSKSEYLDLVASIYKMLIEERISNYQIASVDSLMSPVVSGALSILTGMNSVIVRQRKLEHGVEEKVFGTVEGELVIVDDMTSSGATIIETTKQLREKGGIVRYAVVSAERDSKARKNLAGEGIELLSIASFKEIVLNLREIISQEQMLLLRSELDLEL